jgi:hypothetical protein
LDQKFTPRLLSSIFELFKELPHFGRVEVVNGEPLVNCGLDGMNHMAETVPKLVLDPA